MTLEAVVAEVFAALALGLIAAWLIALVVRAVTQRRTPPERIALRRLEQLPDAPPDAALAARAAILQDYAATVEGDGDWLARLDARFGGMFSEGVGSDLREALYRPGVGFDLDGFDVAIRAALRKGAA